MASVQPRGKSFSVVYYHNGEQKWETFKTEKLANDRKIEVEYQQNKGTFVPPSTKSVAALMEQFINIYGKDKWGFSAYEANVGLIDNYIIPNIGDLAIKDCTTKRMTTFFSKLKQQEAVQQPGRKAPPALISDRNIYEIYGLLDIAFRLAVEWEDLGKHPLTKTMKPASTRGKRETWDEDTAKLAISLCESTRLLVYIHLALGCSMRIGEISGLQKPKLFLDIENGYENPYIKVDVQLSRISKKAYDNLARKKDQIKFIFPNVYEDKDYKTMLVLKTPKTKSSVRTVYLPKTTAKLLHQWLIMQEELKQSLGDAYYDFDLVMALENGRPIESNIIGAELDKLIQDNNLPDVDFHSLRHTSTSVKLVISKGDIKSVQGDTGHAQAKMVTDTYAEIFDGRRKQNAKQFEKEFFSNGIPDDCSEDVLEQLIYSLLNNPNIKDKFVKIMNAVMA